MQISLAQVIVLVVGLASLAGGVFLGWFQSHEDIVAVLIGVMQVISALLGPLAKGKVVPAPLELKK